MVEDESAKDVKAAEAVVAAVLEPVINPPSALPCIEGILHAISNPLFLALLRSVFYRACF